MHRWKLKRVTGEQLMRDSADSDLESVNSLEVQSVGRKLNGVVRGAAHLSRLKCSRQAVEEFEDLPDGSCFNRSMQMTLTPSPDASYSFGASKTTVRACQYTGSFCVTASDQSSRAEFVKTQLEQMRGTAEKKPALLVVSLTGVKICNPQTKSVLMAHALRRISYATCDPTHCQFSFLSREPKGHFSRQFCHSFVTDTPSQAEELNTLLGNAFRMAYAHQLPPSFLELIGKQQRTLVSEAHLLNREVNGNFMTGILNQQPSAAHCRQDDPAVTAEKVWAKTAVNNTRHHDPLIDNVIGTNLMNGGRSTPKLTLPTQSPFSARASSSDLWSPSSSASSCEDNATPAVSPTEVNSCSQIRDKPPLVKTLDTWTEDKRPKSGSYVNEESCWSGNQHKSSTACAKVDTRQEMIPLSPAKIALQVRVPIEKTDVEIMSKRSSSSTPSLSDSSEECRSKRSSQSSTSPPPLPERHDSLQPQIEEEIELRGAPWFQAGIPREIALEVLAQEPVGSFMVRESTSKPGCYALSLRVPREFQQTGIAHYLIMRTNRGFKIKGFTKEFNSLTALITHHSVMPELLPCPLSLSRYNPVFRKQDSSSDVVDIDDPDYNLLSDFRKVMADLKA